MLSDLNDRDPFKQAQPSEEEENTHKDQPQSQSEIEKSEMHKRWLSHEQDCYNDAMLIGQKPAKRYKSHEKARNAGILKFQGMDSSHSVSQKALQEHSRGNIQTDTSRIDRAVILKSSLDGGLSRFNRGVQRLGSELSRIASPANSLKIKPGFIKLNPGFVAAP